MMNVRCEMCNDWLPLLQLSKLCPICYKVRTIVKAYSADVILKKLQEHFLVDIFDIEETKETKETNNNNNEPLPQKLKEDIKKLESDDQKDYEKPKTRNQHRKVIDELKTKM